MRGEVVSPGNVLHHATRFTFDAATTCGKTDQPKPATDEWRYVTCPACLKLAPTMSDRVRGKARERFVCPRGGCGRSGLRADFTASMGMFQCPACGYIQSPWPAPLPPSGGGGS